MSLDLFAQLLRAELPYLLEIAVCLVAAFAVVWYAKPSR